MEQSGLDHGPISVHEKMRDLGMTPVPSTAALARIFPDANVARAEPLRQRSEHEVFAVQRTGPCRCAAAQSLEESIFIVREWD